jgi:predicted nucleic acid-binding protein
MSRASTFGRGRIGVDTAIFIYLIEEDPRFLPLVEPIFEDVAEGRREIVTSALTLLEVLVVPYRAGNAGLATISLAVIRTYRPSQYR